MGSTILQLIRPGKGNSMMGLKPNRIFLSALTFIALAFFLSIHSVQAQEPTTQELLERIETLAEELQYFTGILEANTEKATEAGERAVARLAGDG